MNRLTTTFLCLSFVGAAWSSTASAQCAFDDTFQPLGLTDIAASAMNRAGDMATLLVNGSGEIDSLVVYTFDPVSSTWSLAGAGPLVQPLATNGTGLFGFPRIDLAGDVVVVAGSLASTPGERTVEFYQLDPAGPGLIPGASLRAAAGTWAFSNTQACPNSPTTTVPVPFNPPSVDTFGSDVVITEFGPRLLIHIGDHSHNNTCWPGDDDDGGVWVIELVAVGPNYVPVGVNFLERVPVFNQNFFPSSSMGAALASSETNVPDEGRLAIGFPTIDFGNSMFFGAASVLEIQENGPVFDHLGGGFWGGSGNSLLSGSALSISSEYAFISDSGVNGSVVLERQGPQDWNLTFQNFPGPPPTINIDATNVLATPSSASGFVFEYSLTPGGWLPAAVGTPRPAGSRLGRGATAFAAPMGSRLLRTDGLGPVELYDSMQFSENGINPNSLGVVPQVEASAVACLEDNAMVLTVTGLPANTFGLAIASQDPLRDDGTLTNGLLLQGQIGRYSAQPSGNQGTITQVIDLDAIPHPTLGTIQAVEGQTVSFQFFYRDAGGMGAFSEALQVRVH